MVCDRRTGFGVAQFGVVQLRGGEFGVGQFWTSELGRVWFHDGDGRADRLWLDGRGVRGEAFLFLESPLGVGEPVTDLLLGV